MTCLSCLMEMKRTMQNCNESKTYGPTALIFEIHSLNCSSIYIMHVGSVCCRMKISDTPYELHRMENVQNGWFYPFKCSRKFFWWTQNDCNHLFILNLCNVGWKVYRSLSFLNKCGFISIETIHPQNFKKVWEVPLYIQSGIKAIVPNTRTLIRYCYQNNKYIIDKKTVQFVQLQLADLVVGASHRRYPKYDFWYPSSVSFQSQHKWCNISIVKKIT